MKKNYVIPVTEQLHVSLANFLMVSPGGPTEPGMPGIKEPIE